MSGQAAPVLVLRKAADLVAEPVTWTVDRIIPSGMLTVLSGKDKIGKTLLAWEIARAVTRGQAFLGQFPVTSAPVIFLALDDPAAVTVDRLEQLGLRDEPGLYVATPLDCQHRDPRFWEQVEAQVVGVGARLVIVDALYLFLPLGAEALNQAGAMHPVMAVFNKLTERSGASVLLLAHDSKSGGDVAGSFVIRAAARQILRLGVPGEPHSRRVLNVEGKIAEAGTWALDFAGPGNWRLVEGDTQRLEGTQQAVRAWLERGQVGTVEEIARAIEKRRSDVGTAVSQLQAVGLVKVDTISAGKGRPRKVCRWSFGPDREKCDSGQEPAEGAERVGDDIWSTPINYSDWPCARPEWQAPDGRGAPGRRG